MKYIRVTATLAIIILLISMYIFVIAASIDSKEAIFLSKSGIMVGSNTDLMLDQMFTVLSRLMGEEEIAKNYPTPPSFTDVPKGRWSAPYIAWAESKGITKGNGDGTIGYSDNVNTQRLSMFLLRVLGYNEVPWNEAFEVAGEKGLLEKVSLSAGQRTIRGDIAKIVFSTLETEDKDGLVMGEKLGVLEPAIEDSSLKEPNLYIDLALGIYRSYSKQSLSGILQYSKDAHTPWMTETITYKNGIASSGINICQRDLEEGIQRHMTYDSEGRLENITVYYSPDEKQLKYEEYYELDENNAPTIKVETEWESKTPKPEVLFIYDNEGRLSEKQYQFGMKTVRNMTGDNGYTPTGGKEDYKVAYEFFPQCISYFKYDDTGNIIEEKIRTMDSGLFEVPGDEIYKYKYDELGNSLEMTKYFNGKFENKTNYNYKYDETGRIEEITQYDLLGNFVEGRVVKESDEPKNLNSRYHFTYDDKGNLIEEKLYDRENHLYSMITFEYE